MMGSSIVLCQISLLQLVKVPYEEESLMYKQTFCANVSHDVDFSR